MRFEQFEADRCVFRRIYGDGEAIIFVLVHVDGVIVAARGTAIFEGVVVELGVYYLEPGRRKPLYGVSDHAFPGGRHNQVRSTSLH